MRKNVRTVTLKKHLQQMDASNIRFTKRDKDFLADLAKVRLVGLKDAQSQHYGGKLDGCRKRLQKFVELGLLKERTVTQPGRGQVDKCYEFASDRIAKLYGGRTAGIGSKRSDLHELLVSKAYFALGRPESFKLGDEMTHLEKRALLMPVRGDSEGVTPDAYFMRDGEVVLLESDAGQYNSRQIAHKQASWAGNAQVWVQPNKANCRVPRDENVEVMRF